MADSTIKVTEPTTGSSQLDAESLTVGVETVKRERVEVSGASALEIAAVKAADPASGAYGLVVRAIPSATATPVSEADGASVTLGALADAIVAAGAAGSLSAKLRRVTQGLEDLKTLIVLAAGASIIGKVGIDQTTPGTTDHVTAETKAYTAPATGELAGSVTAVQMPNIACKLVRFKASYDNAGRVNIGATSGVTLADGTTDTTTGFQLQAGEDTGWIPLDNLNRLWRISTAATDDLTYMALA